MHKILVLNNDLDTMTLLKQLLERNTYTVEFTGNKDEILKIARDFQPDLILVDILQQDAIIKLRNNSAFSHIPLILMTGYSLREKRIELLVDEVIEKPFKLDWLESMIEHQLKKPVN
jgi:CheY-like chemotaxis protein